MGADGSLEARAPQSSFSHTYGDARRSDDGLFLFDREEEEEDVAALGSEEPGLLPAPAIPAPAILNAIDETAMRYGAHPALRTVGLTVTEWRRLFRANIEIESAYSPSAESSVGAIGLGQLMPATAASLGVDPHNWRENLDGSARYLLRMLSKFRDARLALAAYNAGPEAVTQYGGIPPYEETQGHVLKVMTVFARLQGDSV